MGANCCIAIRNDKSLPTRHVVEAPTHRTIRYSPSWNFRCDNRTHIEDIVDSQSQCSPENSGSIGSENKSWLDNETDRISDGENPFGSPKCLFDGTNYKSSSYQVSFSNNKSVETVTSIGRNSITEENDSIKSTNESKFSSSKPLAILSSTLSSREVKADPSSSSSHSVPPDLTSSRKAYRLTGYSLSRQISDKNNLTETKQSLVPPTCNSDLTTGGSHSHGGSSDEWSLRMFSELVATQRDRLSFDNENAPFGHNKITTISSHAVSPPPSDVSTCGVCSRPLKERSLLKSIELSVVSVLACGHVYHAECLDNVSSEVNRFDPSCPICTNGGKEIIKMLLKKAEMKARSISDTDLNSSFQREHQQKDYGQSGKGQKMGMTSSLKKSFGKPFLRRHFSMGSGSPSYICSLSESGEGLRKKGFWARYRQE